MDTFELVAPGGSQIAQDGANLGELEYAFGPPAQLPKHLLFSQSLWYKQEQSCYRTSLNSSVGQGEVIPLFYSEPLFWSILQKVGGGSL